MSEFYEDGSKFKGFALKAKGRFTAKSLAEDYGNPTLQYCFVFALADLVRDGRVKCLGVNVLSENVYEVVE